MSYYFVIVGRNDMPLFELDFGTSGREADVKRDENRHLNQFIVHAGLDIVEEVVWTTANLNLRVVDKFNEWFTSAFVTAGGTKFMLLHDTRDDDNIKNFFTDVYELYVKILLNPFYAVDTPISSSPFQHKVKLLTKKYL